MFYFSYHILSNDILYSAFNAKARLLFPLNKEKFILGPSKWDKKLAILQAKAMKNSSIDHTVSCVLQCERIASCEYLHVPHV